MQYEVMKRVFHSGITLSYGETARLMEKRIFNRGFAFQCRQLTCYIGHLIFSIVKRIFDKGDFNSLIDVTEN